MTQPTELASLPGTVEAISALTRLTAQPFELAGVPCILHPNDAKLQLFPELLTRPRRVKKTVELHTTQALIQYWKKFADEESAMFVDQNAATFTAIIDYHSATLADWCEHRAVYACPKTKEWQTWEAHNGKVMAQVDFAYFVEQNLADISVPTGAAMLEIVTSLKAMRQVEFSKGIRLQDGQTQLTYNELLDGKAGPTGRLQIPEEIQLGIAPFQGGVAYAVPAKFRYRITGGNLTMWYDLLRPHKIIEAAFDDIATQIEAAMEFGLLMRGKP